MQTENRFFDDFAKLVNGAAGTFAGMGREAQSSVKEHVKTWFGDDFVSREEFEAVKAMAATARDEVAALRQRLDALDAKANEAAPTSDTPGIAFPE